MTIKQFEVQWIETDMECDACHRGYMRPTGYTLTSQPAKYPYRCNACDHRGTYEVTYPHLTHMRSRPIL